jgi:hypothetical protein
VARRATPVPDNRHDRIVDASVRFHRALFAIRSKFGLGADEALDIVSKGKVRHYREVDRNIKEGRLCLTVLRDEWPNLTDAERLDVATTVTQAASHALTLALCRENRVPGSFRPPSYAFPVKRKRVVVDTLGWIFKVTGAQLPVESIRKRVLPDVVQAPDANALVQEMIRKMSFILDWKEPGEGGALDLGRHLVPVVPSSEEARDEGAHLARRQRVGLHDHVVKCAALPNDLHNDHGGRGVPCGQLRTKQAANRVTVIGADGGRGVLEDVHGADLHRP